MTPHKHAAVIKAWADGAVVQYKPSGTWLDWPYQERAPMFDTDEDYRVKPKPDIVGYGHIKAPDNFSEAGYCNTGPTQFTKYQTTIYNIKCVFDGETGKLKSATVISKD